MLTGIFSFRNHLTSSLPQEQAAKLDMLSVVSIQVLCTVEEGVANACI